MLVSAWALHSGPSSDAAAMNVCHGGGKLAAKPQQPLSLEEAATAEPLSQNRTPVRPRCLMPKSYTTLMLVLNPSHFNSDARSPAHESCRVKDGKERDLRHGQRNCQSAGTLPSGQGFAKQVALPPNLASEAPLILEQTFLRSWQEALGCYLAAERGSN